MYFIELPIQEIGKLWLLHIRQFIDFSKDNTTIVKVEKIANGQIRGTTVFRPDRVQLDDDDKNLNF
jgi:putative ATP-dependent endonuclease of OLD family